MFPALLGCILGGDGNAGRPTQHRSDFRRLGVRIGCFAAADTRMGTQTRRGLQRSRRDARSRDRVKPLRLFLVIALVRRGPRRLPCQGDIDRAGPSSGRPDHDVPGPRNSALIRFAGCAAVRCPARMFIRRLVSLSVGNLSRSPRRRARHFELSQTNLCLVKSKLPSLFCKRSDGAKKDPGLVALVVRRSSQCLQFGEPPSRLDLRPHRL